MKLKLLLLLLGLYNVSRFQDKTDSSVFREKLTKKLIPKKSNVFLFSRGGNNTRYEFVKVHINRFCLFAKGLYGRKDFPFQDSGTTLKGFKKKEINHSYVL